MHKLKLLFILLFCIIVCSSCSKPSNNWYNPSQINDLGVTKKDILQSLKINKCEYTLSDDGYSLKFKNSIDIKGKEYEVTYFFNSAIEGNPLRNIDFDNKAEIISGKDNFDEIKDMANILTKKCGEPDSDILSIDQESPALASFETIDDFLNNGNSTKCYDLWLLEPRTNGIACALYFTYDKDNKYSSLSMSYYKYN